VGENSKIANTGGIRTALIEKMRQIKAPAVRWPGGCFADSYDWPTASGQRINARAAQTSGSTTRLEGPAQERITQLRS